MKSDHGWICPRCTIVHAPWKPTCSCKNLPGYKRMPNFMAKKNDR